jgi:hypothetical protein
MGDHFDNFNKVPTIFGNSEFSLCLEPFKLYEAILITKWSESSSTFNSAAMGVRFLDEYSMTINPYPETDTFKIIKNALKNNTRQKISINFTDNVVIFAKSALTGLNSGNSVVELDEDLLIVRDKDAFLKDANLVVLGKVIAEYKDIYLNLPVEFSNFKDDGYKFNTKFKAKFEVSITDKFRSFKIFQPTNRGDNLAIEAIILASKLPAFLKTANLNKKGQETKIFGMLNRIREYQKEIRRFSANIRALEACNIIDEIISDYF